MTVGVVYQRDKDHNMAADIRNYATGTKEEIFVILQRADVDLRSGLVDPTRRGLGRWGREGRDIHG